MDFLACSQEYWRLCSEARFGDRFMAIAGLRALRKLCCHDKISMRLNNLEKRIDHGPETEREIVGDHPYVS